MPKSKKCVSFLLVEDMPLVYNEDSTRKLVLVSSDPYKQMVYDIPMKSREKDYMAINDFEQIVEINADLEKEFLDFEDKM